MQSIHKVVNLTSPLHSSKVQSILFQRQYILFMSPMIALYQHTLFISDLLYRDKFIFLEELYTLQDKAARLTFTLSHRRGQQRTSCVQRHIFWGSCHSTDHHLQYGSLYAGTEALSFEREGIGVLTIICHTGMCVSLAKKSFCLVLKGLTIK